MTKKDAIKIITKMRDERKTLVASDNLDQESYREEIAALTKAIEALNR